MDIVKTNRMTSLEIAELTGKSHFNVIADCRKLNKNYENLGLLKIQSSYYYNSQNKRQPMFELTKMQVFDLMTGYSAPLRIKVNRRLEELEKANQKPLSQIDLIIQSAQRLKAIEEKEQEQDERIRLLEAKTTIRPEYFTIAAYATINGIIVNTPLAAKLGRAASRLCKQRDLLLDKVKDLRFGFVNAYPEVVLKEVFNNTPIN